MQLGGLLPDSCFDEEYNRVAYKNTNRYVNVYNVQIPDTKLKSNSVNCSFTFGTWTMQGQPPVDIILKCVDVGNTRTDDILGDAINGYFLMNFFQTHSKFFMKYATCFVTYSDNGYLQLAEYDRYPEIFMVKEECTIPKRSMQYQYPKRVYVLINKKIKGKSIMEMLDDNLLLTCPDSDVVTFFDSQLEFSEFLLFFGHKIGLRHCDMHLGNIFFDYENLCNVLIDYGRMYIAHAENTTNQNTTAIMSQFITHVCAKTQRSPQNAKYNDFVKDRSISDNTRFYLCGLTDFMTYALCMFDLLNRIATRIPNCSQFINLINENILKINRRGNEVSIKLPQQILQTIVDYCKQQIDILDIKQPFNNFMKLIVEGLYIVAKFMQFMENNFNRKFNDTPLDIKHIFFSFFQYIAPIECFEMFVTKEWRRNIPEHLSIIKSVFEKVDFPVVGGKKKRMKGGEIQQKPTKKSVFENIKGDFQYVDYSNCKAPKNPLNLPVGTIVVGQEFLKKTVEEKRKLLKNFLHVYVVETKQTLSVVQVAGR